MSIPSKHCFCLESLGFWTLSIVRYSRTWKHDVRRDACDQRAATFTSLLYTVKAVMVFRGIMSAHALVARRTNFVGRKISVVRCHFRENWLVRRVLDVVSSFWIRETEPLLKKVTVQSVASLHFETFYVGLCPTSEFLNTITFRCATSVFTRTRHERMLGLSIEIYSNHGLKAEVELI
jgi:hypothetical protein